MGIPETPSELYGFTIECQQQQQKKKNVNKTKNMYSLTHCSFALIVEEI